MYSDSSPAAGILFAALPLVLCALLNGAQAACVYLDDALLRQLAASGNSRAARISAALSRRAREELTVQLASALCLLVSGWALTGLLAPRFFDRSVPALASVLLALAAALLYVGLGIAAPRRLAGYFPQGMAFALFDLLRLFGLLLAPVAWVLEPLSGLLIRLAGRNPAEQPRSVTEEEIRMLVDEGEERGAIEELEKDMINNIFEFDDRDVSEVMTHRTEVSAVSVGATLDEVVGEAMRSGYSRMPVYVDDIDNICGIVYAKDLLKYLGDRAGFSLEKVMRQPLYVPETGSCSDVFALFQKEKTQIAVVVDEYGGTYGIVTMEDLLESIVGNIQDEYDNERSMVTEVEEGVYILDGSINIAELERILDIRLPDDSGADTLGGFVTELLGGVPGAERAGRALTHDNITFTVLDADERRISRLRAVVHDAEPDEGK